MCKAVGDFGHIDTLAQIGATMRFQSYWNLEFQLDWNQFPPGEIAGAPRTGRQADRQRA